MFLIHTWTHVISPLLHLWLSVYVAGLSSPMCKTISQKEDVLPSHGIQIWWNMVDFANWQLLVCIFNRLIIGLCVRLLIAKLISFLEVTH